MVAAMSGSKIKLVEMLINTVASPGDSAIPGELPQMPQAESGSWNQNKPLRIRSGS